MKLTAVISLEDKFSSTLKKAADEAVGFRTQVDKTRKALDDTFKKKHSLSFEMSMAQTALIKAERNVSNLKQSIIGIKHTTLSFKVQLGSLEKPASKLEKILAVAKKVATTSFQIVFKLLDLVTAPLKMLEKAAKKTAEIVGDSLKGASSLEQTSMTVEHFIKINNKGMSTDKIQQEADKYMDSFRAAPELLGFDNKEVQSAGERAIAVAQGNTTEATNLLRLAADMSAVTPEKSITDALEALADLKKGEGDGMQEFGYYVKESSIKAAGKDLGKVQNNKGIALKDAFKGGGAREAESASGLWTRIKNGLKNGVADMGKDTLQIIKPMLKSWADFFQSEGFRKMFAAGSKLMAGVAKGVVDRSQKLLGWLNTTFIDNVDFQNKDSLGDKFRYVLDKLQVGFNGWYEEEGKAMFAGLIESGVLILEAISPLLTDVAAKIGVAIGEGLIDGLEQVIADHPILAAVAGGVAGGAAGSFFGPLGTLIGAGGGMIAGLATSFGLKQSQKKDEIDKQIKDKTYVVPTGYYADSYLNSATNTSNGYMKDKYNVGTTSITNNYNSISNTKNPDWVTQIGDNSQLLNTNNARLMNKNEPAVVKQTGANAQQKSNIYPFKQALSNNAPSDGNTSIMFTNKEQPLKKQAIGLTRVPYDNYPALLHENERVLTAQEARTINNNSSVTINLSANKQVDSDINRLMAALKSAVESAGFNMAPGGVPA